MSNVTQSERGAINYLHTEIQSKDTTIARLQFIVVVLGLALVVAGYLTYRLAMLV